jgi:hypothetical protein
MSLQHFMLGSWAGDEEEELLSIFSDAAEALKLGEVPSGPSEAALSESVALQPTLSGGTTPASPHTTSPLVQETPRPSHVGLPGPAQQVPQTAAPAGLKAEPQPSAAPAAPQTDTGRRSSSGARAAAPAATAAAAIATSKRSEAAAAKSAPGKAADSKRVRDSRSSKVGRRRREASPCGAA